MNRRLRSGLPHSVMAAHHHGAGILVLYGRRWQSLLANASFCGIQFVRSGRFLAASAGLDGVGLLCIH